MLTPSRKSAASEPSVAVRMAPTKSTWFGSCFTVANGGATDVTFTPELLEAMEPHVSKARRMRDDRRAMDAPLFPESVPSDDGSVAYGLPVEARREVRLSYDPERFRLRELMCAALGIDGDRLHNLHKCHDPSTPKKEVLGGLLVPERRAAFHAAYDEFVLSVAAPEVARLTGSRQIHYSSFPCIRVVRPGEFSIGVHCDTAYGFLPTNINFWLPLVGGLEGTSTLFAESEPGLEDWHPLGGEYGTVTRFWGAQNLHWSTENMGDITRVSLDFRLVPEALWIASHDQYTSVPGYYVVCVPGNDEDVAVPWRRIEPLPQPDHRFGFPFNK